MKFPQEWKDIIKKNKIKHKFISSLLMINPKKFENMIFGYICIPNELYPKLEAIINSIKDGTLKKINEDNNSYKNVKKIKCNVCEEMFKPYGGDLLPICKRCLIMKEHIRKERTKLGLYWEDRDEN